MDLGAVVVADGDVVAADGSIAFDEGI